MSLVESLAAEQRLRIPRVCELTGWSRATLYRRVRDGKFPPPERDGDISFWRAAVVLAALRGEGSR
jgi:predicted DNA-binding transcriptional regulator AlpA